MYAALCSLNKVVFLNLDKEKLDLLVSYKYEIECAEIKLIQQVATDPVIYCGSGRILQKKDGFIHVELYHIFKDHSKEIFPNVGISSPGKIISQEQYFKLEAIDMSGNLWESENISIDGGRFKLPSVGCVIKTVVRTIKNIKNRSHDSKSKYMMLVVSGKYFIPTNHSEDLPNGGFIMNTCKLTLFDSVNVELIDYKEYLSIHINDNREGIEDNFKQRLIEALCICFGRIVNDIYYFLSEGNSITTVLSSASVNFPNKEIVSPIKHSQPWEIEQFKSFIEKYLTFFPKENSSFFGYWHKINRSWQSGIENAALSITTSIEGVTKNYFIEYGKADEEILQQADHAKEIIKNIEIGDRIKNRIMSSIGGVKSSTPKNALYKLAANGKIDKELIKYWSSLRNKSAHSDNLDSSTEELQKYIDEIYIVTGLFHQLLLILIKYDKEYIDFTKSGWSDGKIPA